MQEIFLGGDDGGVDEQEQRHAQQNDQRVTMHQENAGIHDDISDIKRVAAGGEEPVGDKLLGIDFFIQPAALDVFVAYDGSADTQPRQHHGNSDQVFGLLEPLV